jgi:GST-like protein
MIDLYFWPTGNGKKIVILLEELGLPYTIKPINIGRGDQLTPEFLKVSPNGRMPAIVDDEPMGGGAPMSIFESGPIMMYLAEKTGRFYPQAPRGKYDVAQWVGWQLANQGPKLGEQGHFRRAAEAGNNGDLTYALRRFDNEAHRIFGVMNLGLFEKRYLAAGQYTIADMICYPWASRLYPTPRASERMNKLMAKAPGSRSSTSSKFAFGGLRTGNPGGTTPTT